ncbi:hypothetical protein QMN58_32190, partial [Escherichia coli]|nr:hypothetical protein [Escherichia coli]
MDMSGDSEQQQGCVRDARAVFHLCLFRVEHWMDAFPSCRRSSATPFDAPECYIITSVNENNNSTKSVPSALGAREG